MTEVLLAYLAIGGAVALTREQWAIGRFFRALIGWPVVAWRNRGQVPSPPVVRQIPDTWENRIATAIVSLRSGVEAAQGVPDRGAARKTLGATSRGLRQLAARRAELARQLKTPEHDRALILAELAACQPASRESLQERLQHLDALSITLNQYQQQLEQGLSQVLNLAARLHLERARRKPTVELATHLVALEQQVGVMEEVSSLETDTLPAVAGTFDIAVPQTLPVAIERSGAMMFDPVNYKGARMAMVAGILGCSAASMFYRAIATHGLKETSALFIGFPAVIALALVLLPPAKSFTGVLLKVTTLGLLMSGVVFGEGIICIAMAAPIMYLVAIATGFMLDVMTKRSKRLGTRVAILLPWLPLSFEGTPVGWEMDRAERVTVTQVLAAPAAQIEHGWASRLPVNAPLPVFFKLGFPVPVGAAGQGLALGDSRLIHFAGGEGSPGTLRLEVTARFDDGVRFSAVSDTSHIDHWLTWRDIEVHWQAVDADHTRVTWTAEYDRGLDPGLYFGPIMRFGVAQAGETLIAQLGGTHVD